jgi:mannitol/fructose-specific phosphotransferase system IIA component (Ntr-type)
MNLAEFTRPQLLNASLKAADANGAILELSKILAAEGLVADPKSFCNRVLERERLSPTDMEAEWALPHARIAGLAQPWFALGRSLKPIRWPKLGASGGGSPVRLVMLLAAPEPDTKGFYLKLISTWARSVKQTDLTKRLLQAEDGLQMFEALGGAELRRAGDPPSPEALRRAGSAPYLVAARAVLPPEGK